jgi:hypothetical protein
MLNYKVVVQIVAEDVNGEDKYICENYYDIDKTLHRGFLSYEIENMKQDIDAAYFERLNNIKPKLRLVK